MSFMRKGGVIDPCDSHRSATVQATKRAFQQVRDYDERLVIAASVPLAHHGERRVMRRLYRSGGTMAKQGGDQTRRSTVIGPADRQVSQQIGTLASHHIVPNGTSHIHNQFSAVSWSEDQAAHCAQYSQWHAVQRDNGPIFPQ